MRLFFCLILIIYAVAETFTGCLSDRSGNSCQDSKKKYHEESAFPLMVPEPSGLAFSPSKNALFVISDKTGRIYKISFTGEVLEKLAWQGHDLEGIDVDKTNGDVWVVEEKKQIISHLNSNGDLIERITDVHLKTKGNPGFEGIAKNENKLYILIEKDPGTLIVYNLTSKKWDSYTLSFAKDYSGIDYDITDNTIWIVSDESKTLNHCNLDGTLIKSQKIDVTQAEGVAVDRSGKIAWVVSDNGQKLHRITLKD